MHAFAALLQALEDGETWAARRRLLRDHLAGAEPADAAWAVQLLAGGRLRRAVPPARLRSAALQAAAVPAWLFDECQQAAGDLAETIAHLLPPPAQACDAGLAAWIEQRLLPLQGLDEEQQAAKLAAAWAVLTPTARRCFTRLAGGGWRSLDHRLLLQHALAEATGAPGAVLAQRLAAWPLRGWPPDAAAYEALTRRPDPTLAESSRPFPFQPLQPLEAAPPAWLDPQDCIVLWLSEGPRVQLVRQAGGLWLWSGDDQLALADALSAAPWAQALPEGCVLDGHLRPARDGSAAARFVAFDLLQWQGEDWRGQPPWRRQQHLSAVLAQQPAHRAATLVASDPAALAALHAQARGRGQAGLLLARREATGWWAWPADLLTADAVLVYAEAGDPHDAAAPAIYGFAVWSQAPRDEAEVAAVLQAIERREPPAPQGLRLLPLAKAGSGLSVAEHQGLQALAASTTVQRFGPVRSLKPTLVVRLGFEQLALSRRTRSGLVLQQARMLQLCPDTPLQAASTLQDMQALMSRMAPSTA